MQKEEKRSIIRFWTEKKKINKFFELPGYLYLASDVILYTTTFYVKTL